MAIHPLPHPYRASCSPLWPLVRVYEEGVLPISTKIKDFPLAWNQSTVTLHPRQGGTRHSNASGWGLESLR